jgi:hypothetical protein
MWLIGGRPIHYQWRRPGTDRARKLSTQDTAHEGFRRVSVDRHGPDHAALTAVMFVLQHVSPWIR